MHNKYLYICIGILVIIFVFYFSVSFSDKSDPNILHKDNFTKITGEILPENIVFIKTYDNSESLFIHDDRISSATVELPENEFVILLASLSQTYPDGIITDINCENFPKQQLYRFTKIIKKNYSYQMISFYCDKKTIDFQNYNY